MSISRYLVLLCLAVTAAGCQPRLAGDYCDPPIGKNPARLQLRGDGSYSFGATFPAEGSVEHGRWWRIEDHVVMLVPDAAGSPQWFARVGKNGVLRQLERSTEVRTLLKETP